MPHRANLVARILLSVIVISLLSGCLYRPGGIAPSNIPLEGRSYRMVGETAASTQNAQQKHNHAQPDHRPPPAETGQWGKRTSGSRLYMEPLSRRERSRQ